MSQSPLFVRFYLLPAHRVHELPMLALTLLKKAMEAKEPTLLLHDDPLFLKGVSDALWGDEPSRFLHHQLLEIGDRPSSFDFIYLSTEEVALPHSSLLINLSQRVPKELSSYRRIFELSSHHADFVQSAREHYRYYQRAGAEIEHVDC